jgi:hypothetical protein
MFVFESKSIWYKLSITYLSNFIYYCFVISNIDIKLCDITYKDFNNNNNILINITKYLNENEIVLDFKKYINKLLKYLK